MIQAIRQVGVNPAASVSAAGYARRGLSADGLRTLLAAGRKLDTQDPALARQAAAQFLAELFYVPLLSEARDFPLGRELATGGRTEAIFGAQLDQRIADAVAAANRGLVDQVAQRFNPALGRAPATRAEAQPPIPPSSLGPPGPAENAQSSTPAADPGQVGSADPPESRSEGRSNTP